MTQRTLSRKSKVNVTKISFIENGIEAPTETERKQIARALKAEVHDVFPMPEAVSA